MYADPEMFVIARPVCSEWSPKAIEHPEVEGILGSEELTKELDCWHVACAVGSMKHLLALLPYHLPYISMKRGAKPRLRIYPLKRILK